MSRRTSASSITVTFSTRGAVMPAWMVQHIAAAAALDGIDVDAGTPVSLWLAGMSGNGESGGLPVRSIWFSPAMLKSKRCQMLLDSIAERQTSKPPLVVVAMSAPSTVREVTREMQPSLRSFREWPVAIGLPSIAFRGGRPHLVQLGALRRFAEEWDLAIAVDLSGRFDPTWEAEAAIARLGERLGLLRIRATASSRSAVGRDRVACRALHAAIDRDRPVDVAITPTRMVPLTLTPRAAAFAAERAAGYIVERATIHAQALREDIDRYEGSPTSRGT
jgi:hypothetical protein